ncbi:MAG: hypothetical protein AB1465_07355, partial [Patescibacteria group bacterium]
MRQLGFFLSFLIAGLFSCSQENNQRNFNAKNYDIEVKNYSLAQQNLVAEELFSFCKEGDHEPFIKQYIPGTNLNFTVQCFKNQDEWFKCFNGKFAYELKIRLNTEKTVLNDSITIFDIHLGFWKDSEKMICVVLYISSDIFFKKKPCINLCDKKWKALRKKVKKAMLSAFVAMGASYAVAKEYRDKIWPGVKLFINVVRCLMTKVCSFGVAPADDGFDEPDDFDQNPPIEQGEPSLQGCECNAPEDDGNICFDDSFGKPNPVEYKQELTVIGRDENYLYIFGKDASLFDRAIFWSDPNSLGLGNCESWGAWDGTFMVHKLQPCRTWFSLTNESHTIWLSPDSAATRV